MSTITAQRPPEVRRHLPLALAGLLVLTAIGYPLTTGTARDTVTWSIVLLGAGVSIAHATLGRGWRTGAGVLALVAVAAVLIEAVGLATGFPYGDYTYSDALGPTLLGVPFLVPLAWLMMAWPSWVLAARLVGGVGGEHAPRGNRPHRGTPLLRIAVAAYLFAAWDVVLDPQLVQAGYWTWAHPAPGLPGIDSVPLTNLGGWLLAGLVLMTLLDLVVTRTSAPSGPRIGDGAPLLTIGWMTLGAALAQLGWLGLPGSATWGVLLAAPVLTGLLVPRRHFSQKWPLLRKAG